MGMSADDDLDVCRHGIQVQMIQVEQHINMAPLDLDPFTYRQSLRRFSSVAVASHRIDRGQLPQRLQKSRRAHVPRMQDHIDTFETVLHFIAQKTMGV